MKGRPGPHPSILRLIVNWPLWRLSSFCFAMGNAVLSVGMKLRELGGYLDPGIVTFDFSEGRPYLSQSARQMIEDHQRDLEEREEDQRTLKDLIERFRSQD